MPTVYTEMARITNIQLQESEALLLIEALETLIGLNMHENSGQRLDTETEKFAQNLLNQLEGR